MCKKKFICHLTTRYAETDQMGVIHHSTYATYFELARTEWLLSLGLSYSKLEKKGILLPVLSLSIEFKHPLYFEDQIPNRDLFGKRSKLNYRFFVSNFESTQSTLYYSQNPPCFSECRDSKNHPTSRGVPQCAQ